MFSMTNEETGAFLAYLLLRPVCHSSAKEHGGLKDSAPVNKYGWEILYSIISEQREKGIYRKGDVASHFLGCAQSLGKS